MVDVISGGVHSYSLTGSYRSVLRLFRVGKFEIYYPLYQYVVFLPDEARRCEKCSQWKHLAFELDYIKDSHVEREKK
jgi:hypothetical protein